MTETKFTPGPWGWFGDPKHGGFYLATRHSGRRFVMEFGRMGLHSAQPLFQVDGVMVDAKELCRFEVAPDVVGMTAANKPGSGVYRHDIIGFDHADAHLIAAAPDLYEALYSLTMTASRYLPEYNENPLIQDAEAALAKARGEE